MDKKENHELHEMNSLLARIDERTLDFDRRLDHLDTRFEEYITRHEFTPVKLLAYGFAGILLVSVITAIVATAVG